MLTVPSGATWSTREVPSRNGNGGEVADVDAALGGERDAGRDRVPLGDVRHPGDRAVRGHGDDLAAVGLDDPEGGAIGCGDHPIPLALRLDLRRVGDRVGLVPGAQVGHHLMAAVRLDPIKAGRLVRITVATAPAGDESVELIAQDRHIRDADDRGDHVEARRQSGSDRDRAPVGADPGNGRRRAAADFGSGRRREGLPNRRVGAAVAGQGDEERAVCPPRHTARVGQTAGDDRGRAGCGTGGGRGVLGSDGAPRAEDQER